MIVLDTHILLWWASGDGSLPDAARKAIGQALDNGDEIVISAISAWEIAMLIDKGRLVLGMDVEDWIAHATRLEGVRFRPVDAEIGVKATLLPGTFHSDPADRMIVATARKLNAPLITADRKVLAYPHVNTIG